MTSPEKIILHTELVACTGGVVDTTEVLVNAGVSVGALGEDAMVDGDRVVDMIEEDGEVEDGGNTTGSRAGISFELLFLASSSRDCHMIWQESYDREDGMDSHQRRSFLITAKPGTNASP
jgi:hypothetical protein